MSKEKISKESVNSTSHKTDVIRSYKGLPKPKLEDFYDISDPRGCSSSEYEDYVKAVKKWEIENKS